MSQVNLVYLNFGDSMAKHDYTTSASALQAFGTTRDKQTAFEASALSLLVVAAYVLVASLLETLTSVVKGISLWASWRRVDLRVIVAGFLAGQEA